MPKQPSSTCPYCATPLNAAQSFCQNCGSTVIMDNGQQTRMSHGDQNIYSQPGTTPSDPYTPPLQYVEPPQYRQQAYPAAGGNYQNQVPDYARVPARDSSKSVLMQIGCGFMVMLLVIVGLCTGGVYLAYRWASSQPADNSSQNYMHVSTMADSQMPFLLQANLVSETADSFLIGPSHKAQRQFLNTSFLISGHASAQRLGATSESGINSVTKADLAVSQVTDCG